MNFEITELPINSIGLFVRIWSPMIFRWLYCIQYHCFLSTCGGCLVVMFEFE